MESFYYYSWYLISFTLLPIHFFIIDYELLCDFLQSYKYYVKIICIKGKEGTNDVMASNEFGNDLMGMCFENFKNNESSLSI